MRPDEADTRGRSELYWLAKVIGLTPASLRVLWFNQLVRERYRYDFDADGPETTIPMNSVVYFDVQFEQNLCLPKETHQKIVNKIKMLQ